jgi:hypothetical protein
MDSAPLGTSQVAFRCKLVSQSDSSQVTIAWTDPGFTIDMTGPPEPLQLNTSTAEPGQTLLTQTGAPGGPEPCPDITPSRWESIGIGADWPGDAGIIIGNLGSHSPYGSEKQFLLPLRSDVSPGRYYLGADCSFFNADGTFSAFNFEDRIIELGDPATADPAPLGGALSPAETFGADNPAESACGCAEGWAGDPVNTANGDYYETDTDASVSGNGPDLTASRTYNSAASSTAGPFGYGWTSTYGAHLVIDSSTANVTVVQGDGAQVAYTYQSSTGTFSPGRVTRHGDIGQGG